MSTGISPIRESLCTLGHEFGCQLFHDSIGNGSWVTAGVRTNDIKTQNTKNGNITTVQCTSTHLTSFAVLVDVAGGLEVIRTKNDASCMYNFM